MFTNVSYQIVKLIRPGRVLRDIEKSNHKPFCNKFFYRQIQEDRKSRPKHDEAGASETNTSELVTLGTREIIEKEFPEYFSNGKFIRRISYVDFIDQALEKLKDLGLHRDLHAYKELLKIFPPGRYHPTSLWDLGLHHAPQQICAVRLLQQMEYNQVKPDREVEALVIKAFSKNSDVWKKIARMNYWSMKGRNVDLYPLPEQLPKEPEQLAKVALARMLQDPKSIITVTSTNTIPDSVDKTWVVHAQSPVQSSIIEGLNDKSILYIEESGLAYVDRDYLSYYTLKVYDDEETKARRNTKKEPDFNYNTVKVQFYGKPVKDKLRDMADAHHVDDHYILAVGVTGTSSQDSALSWLKIMQKRNPKLSNLNVVFKFRRPTNEMYDPNANEGENRKQQKDDLGN